MAQIYQEFVEELILLKKQILSNKEAFKYDNKLLPRYAIRQSFFSKRSEKIEENIKNLERKDYLNTNFQKFQELRMTKLFYFLEEANKKFKIHTENKESFLGNGTSQLCIVYDIIRNSKELISLIYLLEWLQSIFMKDKPRRNIERKFFFSEKIENAKSSDFDPDIFNDPTLLKHFSSCPSTEDFREYSRVFERIVMNVRSGNLLEAQHYAKYNNLFNISVINLFIFIILQEKYFFLFIYSNRLFSMEVCPPMISYSTAWKKYQK